MQINIILTYLLRVVDKIGNTFLLMFSSILSLYLDIFNYCDISNYSPEGITPLLKHYNITNNMQWAILYDDFNITSCVDIDSPQSLINLSYAGFIMPFFDKLKANITIFLSPYTYPPLIATNLKYITPAFVLPSSNSLYYKPNCFISIPFVDVSPSESYYDPISFFSFLGYLIIAANIFILLFTVWLIKNTCAKIDKSQSFNVIMITLTAEFIAVIFRLLIFCSQSFDELIFFMLILLPLPLLIMGMFTILTFWYDALKSMEMALNMKFRKSRFIGPKFLISIVFLIASAEAFIFFFYLLQDLGILFTLFERSIS